MHDGDNPKIFRCLHVNQGVRKIGADVPAGGWIEHAVAIRVGRYVRNQPFSFTVETNAQGRTDFCVIAGSFGKFQNPQRDGARPSLPNDLANSGQRLFHRDALRFAALDFLNALVDLGFPGSLDILLEPAVPGHKDAVD